LLKIIGEAIDEMVADCSVWFCVLKPRGSARVALHCQDFTAFLHAQKRAMTLPTSPQADLLQLFGGKTPCLTIEFDEPAPRPGSGAAATAIDADEADPASFTWFKPQYRDSPFDSLIVSPAAAAPAAAAESLSAAHQQQHPSSSRYRSSDQSAIQLISSNRIIRFVLFNEILYKCDRGQQRPPPSVQQTNAIDSAEGGPLHWHWHWHCHCHCHC
jgi:hypothetical protein